MTSFLVEQRTKRRVRDCDREEEGSLHFLLMNTINFIAEKYDTKSFLLQSK